MTRTPEQATFRLIELLNARPELAVIFMDIALELLRAEGLHPDWSTDAAHALGFLTEEVGGRAEAVNEFQADSGDPARRAQMNDRAMQVGTMAVRCLLHLQRIQISNPQRSQASKRCAA